MSPKFLLVVLLLAFALRAGAVLAIGDREQSPDALNDYLPMAANFLAGKGLVNGAGEADYVRGPGYSLTIAAIQSVWPYGGVKPILWAQALLDTLTTFLVVGMATRSMGGTAGLIAGVLYAVNPLTIYSCPLVGPEILFAFLLTGAVSAYTRGLEENLSNDGIGAVWMAIAGLTMGLAVLTRATPALLVPLWGAWVLVRQFLRLTEVKTHDDSLTINMDGEFSWIDGIRRGVLAAVILGGTAAVAVLPWTYRNWVVFHEFIPVVANGGVNFYSGSSERFWPAPPEHHRQRALRRDELIELGVIPSGDHPKSPAAGDKYQFAMGTANYRLAWNDDPAGLVFYLIRKSFRIWYATQSGRMERFVGAINVSYLVLALAGFGICVWRRRGIALMPCLLTVAYFPLVLTAMFPLARYVVGFAPCLCVMAAGLVLLSRSQSLNTVEVDGIQ